VDRTEAEEAEGARCPACREALRAARVGETPLAECERCHGVFVDTRSFARLCEEKEQQAAVLSRSPRTEAAAPVPADVRYRPCARCDALMHRQNFARISGVLVDVCRTHGVWFDGDELARVVAFIRDGGLDRSRAREKSDLEEERRRLAAKQFGERVRATSVSPGPGDNAGLLDVTSDALTEGLAYVVVDILTSLND
jgi:Zn-finger nucleic acid-binding protein